MTDSMDLNPYLPSQTADASEPALPGRPQEIRVVGSLELGVWTIGTCGLAGALFGTLTGLLFFSLSLWSGQEQWDAASIGIIGGMLILSLYGIVIGGLLALLASLPTVAGLLITDRLIWGKRLHWSREAIGQFAALAGLIAGFLPISLISGLDLGGLLISVVPAMFGCFACRVMIIPLARKAQPRSPRPLSK